MEGRCCPRFARSVTTGRAIDLRGPITTGMDSIGAVAAGTTPALTPERQGFYGRLKETSAAPLLEVLSRIVPREPAPETVPAAWRYDELRPLLMEAGRLLTAEEAARRGLLLENPGVPGKSKITPSLYVGLQLILPGEVAPRVVAWPARFGSSSRHRRVHRGRGRADDDASGDSMAI
jgi:gentisate 1,2-dioxygenase